MLFASCSKIEDEYVYDTGYAIDWSAAADSASSTLPDRFGMRKDTLIIKMMVMILDFSIGLKHKLWM